MMFSAVFFVAYLSYFTSASLSEDVRPGKNNWILISVVLSG
jgi:hypothetical protein